MKFIKNNSGTTFLEIIVSISLFAVAVISVVEIFMLVLNGQRTAIASRNINENMLYAFEVMNKDLRMAHIDSGDCSNVADTSIYDVNASGDELYFKNYHSECIHYYLENDRIKVDKNLDSGYLTPDEIKVSNLKFIVQESNQLEQAMVTMKMDIETIGGKAKNKEEMKIQTTISSRYY